MKRLTEIFGLNEGPFDDINKQLAGAKSVAGGSSQRTRVGASGAAQRAQADLDQSTSIVKKEAMPAASWNNKSVPELFQELVNLTDDLPPDMKVSALQVIQALQGKVEEKGGMGSSSMTRSMGSLKLQ